jgi:hypothetical protein
MLNCRESVWDEKIRVRSTVCLRTQDESVTACGRSVSGKHLAFSKADPSTSAGGKFAFRF